MEFKVGDKVSVLDTKLLYDAHVGDVGIVTRVLGRYLEVDFPQCGYEQYVYPHQVQPVSEVIKVDCHKPNVLQRIWNHLRGIK